MAVARATPLLLVWAAAAAALLLLAPAPAAACSSFIFSCPNSGNIPISGGKREGLPRRGSEHPAAGMAPSQPARVSPACKPGKTPPSRPHLAAGHTYDKTNNAGLSLLATPRGYAYSALPLCKGCAPQNYTFPYAAAWLAVSTAQLYGPPVQGMNERGGCDALRAWAGGGQAGRAGWVGVRLGG